MNYLNLTIFMVFLMGAKAFSTPNLAQTKFDSTLANYLVKSNSMDYAVNPSMSAQCFNLYLPMLSEIANTFSTQYQACNTVANQKMDNLTEAADKNRATFIQETNDICTAYQNCVNESDVLSFFNCYSRVSTKEVSVVYTISSDASTAADTFSTGLKTIQNDQSLCTNATETTYVDNTAITYKLLDECLKNGPPTTVSTTAVTTTTEFVPTAPTVTTVSSADNKNDDYNSNDTSGSQAQS